MAARCNCVMSVCGDIAEVNTFDAKFRSLPPPQWSDRESITTPRYSLNALRPVPEDILRRGHGTAGRLWCRAYWDTPDDFDEITVRRGVGFRVYRFATRSAPPVGALLHGSFLVPPVKIHLTLLRESERKGERHTMQDGWHQTAITPRRDDLEDLLADWEWL